MKQEITLKIPLKISTNEIYAGVHWSVRKKHKDLFLWSMLGLKKLRHTNKCELEFEFNFKNKPLDCDNCSYMTKLCIDCLTYYKVIPNDTYDIVQGVNLKSIKGTENLVKITIKDIE